MKRRIIKGLLGVGGVRRSAQYDYLTQDPTPYIIKALPEDVAQEAYLWQHTAPYNEPWWSKTFRYVQNPFDLASDYIQESEWAPEWMKRIAPWGSFGLAMAASGGTGGKRGAPKRITNTEYTGPDPSAYRGQNRASPADLARQMSWAAGYDIKSNGDVAKYKPRGRPRKEFSSKPSPIIQATRKWFAEKLGLPIEEVQEQPVTPTKRTRLSDIETLKRGRGRPTKQSLAEIYETYKRGDIPTVINAKSSGKMLINKMNQNILKYFTWAETYIGDLISKVNDTNVDSMSRVTYEKSLSLAYKSLARLRHDLAINGYNVLDYNFPYIDKVLKVNLKKR